MELEEVYGQKSLRRRYTYADGQVRKVDVGGSRQSWRNKASKFIKEAFLPQGYPESVSSDYLSYQVWDTVQAFCSSITGALATLAILKGVGVGDSSATPLAAALTWMLKDGTGMLGRILFAWMAATDLDCNAKFWRLIADILNDVANFLELIAPLFPSVMFLPVVCAASVAKAIVGTAGGATRAALVQHQARRDNMADVAAKDGSQETVVNLLALLVNLVLTPLVAGKTEVVWTLFITFTIFHLLANHRAVSVVAMETLNHNRLHLLVSSYLAVGRIPSVTEVNGREPILSRLKRVVRYQLGLPLADVVISAESYELAKRKWLQDSRRHIWHFHTPSHCIKVALESKSDVSTQLKIAVAAELVDYLLQSNWSPTPQAQHSLFAFNHLTLQKLKGHIEDTLVYAEQLVEQDYTDFINMLNEEGWVTSHLLLGTGEWRYSWDDRKAL